MAKHAYLIMAHDQLPLLRILLTCLDHEDNDIYIHMDKRASCDFSGLKTAVKKSGCWFTPRIRVSWGGYSQIEAELILLQAAVERGGYAYYHLITGADLPLCSQDRIHAFFDSCGGKEFISCNANVSPDFADRLRYYYPFQEYFPRGSLPGRILRGGLLRLQKLLRVNRLKRLSAPLGVGSAYFDITETMARYVLSQTGFIRKHFRHTLCCDELFLQTVYLSSPYADQGLRYQSTQPEHPFIKPTYLDVLRAIDWTRGNPYTYTDEDYEMLMASGCLFARKFRYDTAPELVHRIAEQATKTL